MASQRGLTVRGHERQRIELPIEFVVADEHRAQVRFSPNSSAHEQFGVSGTTFDLSIGGLGFSAAHYLPRHCEGTVRVRGVVDTPVHDPGHEIPAVRIEHRVKVRRVWMNNDDNSYMIGLSFLNVTPALEAQINDLLHDVERAVAGTLAPNGDELGAPDHA